MSGAGLPRRDLFGGQDDGEIVAQAGGDQDGLDQCGRGRAAEAERPAGGQPTDRVDRAWHERQVLGVPGCHLADHQVSGLVGGEVDA